MSDDVAAFTRMLDALHPWREHLVIVGGWAHRLHRYHPDAIVPSYTPIVTRDADVAIASPKTLKGNIATALQASGFNEELTGAHVPPVSRYTLGDENVGFYTEFLSPLAGSGRRRDGKGDATVHAAGVTAQKLRHLEVLLIAPWTLALGVAGPLPVTTATMVRVASPVGFLVQKLLIHPERRGSKKAQDILYINDTLELFGGRLDLLRSQWTAQFEPALSERQRTPIQAATGQVFGSVTDSIRAAARIALAAGRTISPEEVRLRCAVGLEAILLPAS